MTGVPLYESLAGLLLLYVLPGYAIGRAVFPEWRLHGPGWSIRLIEEAALAILISPSLTILVGSALAASPGPGFQAGWGMPLLEIILATVTAVALVVAAIRGAFSRVPPVRAPAPGEEISHDTGWATLRGLERVADRERKLRRALARAVEGSDEQARLTTELRELDQEKERIATAGRIEIAR